MLWSWFSRGGGWNPSPIRGRVYSAANLESNFKVNPGGAVPRSKEELCQGLSLFLFSSVTFKVHQHYEFNGCEFFVLFIWLKVDSENLALQFRREKWMHLYGTGPLWNILGPRKIIFWLYFSIGLINISLGLFRESKKVSVLNFDPMQRGPNLLQRQPN